MTGVRERKGRRCSVAVRQLLHVLGVDEEEEVPEAHHVQQLPPGSGTQLDMSSRVAPRLMV